MNLENQQFTVLDIAHLIKFLHREKEKHYQNIKHIVSYAIKSSSPFHRQIKKHVVNHVGLSQEQERKPKSVKFAINLLKLSIKFFALENAILNLQKTNQENLMA